ncbi:MAG TPA: hypothetical protein VHX20_11875 [Terracidiphilus sp.]|jgi:hypothetical protein|nr:hypothetical protein [Terracidiphilus sp.]
MLEAAHIGASWILTSTAEREQVEQELEAILANHHFRGSKRYPAFLKYVVDATLAGRAGDLKERTLGIEVFGRAPDYDTSADPVVRFSASEVRKRLAQYYHEHADRPGLRIELPLGSYVPQFFERNPDSTPEGKFAAVDYAHPGRRRAHRMRWIVFASVAALLLLGGIYAAYSRRDPHPAKPLQADALWEPLLQDPGQVMIVLGTSHPGRASIESSRTSFIDYMTGPYHHVSVATAVALAHLAAVLRLHGSLYEVKEGSETSLTDLHARPVILIGATNNAWTMRLVNSLRFHFVFDGRIARIEDARNPGDAAWAVDFGRPFHSVYTDYAIVARFRDPVTEGPVMVIAGLGSYGTQAASEFVTSPLYLKQMMSAAPAGWQNRNVEFVLRSDVIGGKAGPPQLVATAVW